MRSLASGGCTSTKYCVLIYLEANFPKWTSSKLRKTLRCHTMNIDQVNTYTTLLGFDNRNSRTPEATSTMRNSNFHSPEVISRPPDGKFFVLPGANPFDAAARRSSASKCSSRGCGNRCEEYDTPGGGEAGRLALKLPDMGSP